MNAKFKRIDIVAGDLERVRLFYQGVVDCRPRGINHQVR